MQKKGHRKGHHWNLSSDVWDINSEIEGHQKGHRGATEGPGTRKNKKEEKRMNEEATFLKKIIFTEDQEKSCQLIKNTFGEIADVEIIISQKGNTFEKVKKAIDITLAKKNLTNPIGYFLRVLEKNLFLPFVGKPPQPPAPLNEENFESIDPYILKTLKEKNYAANSTL